MHCMKIAILATLATFAVLSPGCSNTSHDSHAGSGPGAIGFDGDATGTLPAGWTADATNPEGPLATWTVHKDAKAASPGNVLALTSVNHKGQDAFNLCWSKSPQFKDGTLHAAVRADDGQIDQGGGLAWRIRDAKNYYICRFNPLESNIRVYSVKDGKRVQLATATVKAKAGEWHHLEVEHAGKHIVCSLDGKKLLDADDATFTDAGGVGFWTKADARTSFDDLSIRAR
jgi:hypothetical protein